MAIFFIQIVSSERKDAFCPFENSFSLIIFSSSFRYFCGRRVILGQSQWVVLFERDPIPYQIDYSLIDSRCTIHQVYRLIYLDSIWAQISTQLTQEYRRNTSLLVLYISISNSLLDIFVYFWDRTDQEWPDIVLQIFQFLRINHLYYLIFRPMMCMMGARNTRGFSAAVNSGNLPDLTHLTYQGIFNEIKFDVGKRTDKIVDLHHGYSRYQFAKSMFDANINDYLALFLKSSKDGADRDDTPINAVISLDISGSMNGGLGQNSYVKNTSSRLKLSVEAIKMFISKLRPNDSIGLTTFSTQGQTIFAPTFKKDLSQSIYDELDKITAGGGTLIRSGFALSKQLLTDFINKNQCINCENRIIMLTDVGDNSISGQKQFIEQASVQSGINLTVVGISSEFKSSVCEQLKNVKGFNYFCAVNSEDIKKYVFQTFDYGFFPAAYDLDITISSQDLAQIEVFGAPDAAQVPSYNEHFKVPITTYTISKVKSVFPSQLELHKDVVYTIGGLILVKLKRKSDASNFKAQINLKYRTPKGEWHEQSYPIAYQFHPTEQFFSQECLRHAIEGYAFTSEMRALIKAAKNLKKKEIHHKFAGMLADIKEIVPQCKIKDYDNIKKIVDGYGKVVQGFKGEEER